MAFHDISQVLHAAPSGALATQSRRMPGYPYASALPFALDEQHRPVFLISRLAEHTANLIADSRASLLVCESDGDDVLATARLTLVGDAAQFEPSGELVARYLRYHPDAGQYLALGDFAFFRFTPKRARFVAGFGRMGWVDEGEWADAAILPLADEAALITELAGVQASGVRLLGIDPYGFDVMRDRVRERRRFADAPVEAGALRGLVTRLFSGG
jgi:putative heme iron utilization protein